MDKSNGKSSDPNKKNASSPRQRPSKEPSRDYPTEPLDTARISGNPRDGKNESSKEEPYRDSKKIEDLYDYAVSNQEKTLAYLLLALGLLFLLFLNNMLGGLIIGMVAGYYFAPEITYYFRHMTEIFSGQDQLRYVVLTALLLGLFIAAPGIFIGAAVVAAFRHMFISK